MTKRLRRCKPAQHNFAVESLFRPHFHVFIEKNILIRVQHRVKFRPWHSHSMFIPDVPDVEYWQSCLFTSSPFATASTARSIKTRAAASTKGCFSKCSRWDIVQWRSVFTHFFFYTEQHIKILLQMCAYWAVHMTFVHALLWKLRKIKRVAFVIPAFDSLNCL